MNERHIRKLENGLILLAITTLMWLLFTSCQTAQNTMSGRVDSVYIQKLVPVVLPTDSSAVKALLECNIHGRVVLNQLEMETTRNAQLSFLLDSLGNLRVETIVKRDTQYVKTDRVRVSEVITRFEYIEKPLGRWDSFILRFGNWMFGGLCAVIAAMVLFVFLKLKARIRV